MEPPGQEWELSRRATLRLARLFVRGGPALLRAYRLRTRHTITVAYQRDPVSELFDGAARALLARAYARPGAWAGSRIADPSPRHRAWLADHGIEPFERDQVGSGMAKTRWARGFVRALYYQHKWWSATGGGFRADKRATYRQTGALVVEIGNVVVARGVIPRGRAVRVMLAPGGQVKARAVDRTADRETWANQGPAWADPGKRDW